MQIHIVDPPAYTPFYDRELAAALARTGIGVELITSRFAYGAVPTADGYRVTESFYRLASRVGATGRAQRALRLVEHVPNMLSLRRRSPAADLIHYQWLSVQQVDRLLLPPARPRVMTAHDILPREPRPGQLSATRALLRKMDGVVVHSDHGRWRLLEEVGLSGDRVRVIPHGAFDYLTRLPSEQPLPNELDRVSGPVILFFGLLRPYKGLDTLLEAFAQISGAELWIVGMPRMALGPLHEIAREASGRVRFVTRFIADEEVPAYFRRADIVVLPYRDIDQSGVLYAALAFGKPLVLSRVGGFVEIAERHGVARLVPPGRSEALATALAELIEDRNARTQLAAAALRAAEGPYAWDAIARQTLAFYRELIGSTG